MKSNIDEAFLRRFRSVIYFPIPNALERYQIWQNVFSNELIIDPAVDFKKIAEKYEFTGESIVNIALTVSLWALDNKTNTINRKLLISVIDKELKKHSY